MNVRNIFRILLIGAGILFSLFSCVKDIESRKSSTDIRLALMVKRADNDWYQLLIRGFENRCKQLGINFLILDNRMDYNLTLSDIDTLISRKVNGVAIAIPDQKMSWIIVNRIFEAGIPVVSLNYKLVDKQRRQLAPHIGIDYKKAAVVAEQWLAERLKAKGILINPSVSYGVAELYSKSVLEIQEWVNTIRMGLLKDLKEINPNRFYRINSPVNDAAGAMITMQELLSQHPDITNWIVYAGSSDEMTGALRALDQVGMKKYSITLSIEAAGTRVVPAPDRGIILVNTYEQGEKAADLLYKNVRYKVPIPSRIYSPYKLIK